MKIKATKTKAGDLKPGDLFSTGGPTYWNNIKNWISIGEKVYIRTETPTPEQEKDWVIYLIEIER